MRSFRTLAIVLFGSAALVVFRPGALHSAASEDFILVRRSLAVTSKATSATTPASASTTFLVKINLSKAERWFCSEAEALAAGWRKARI